MARKSKVYMVTTITSLYRSEKYLESFLQNCLEQSAFNKTFFLLNISCPSREELSIIKKYLPSFNGQLSITRHKKLVSIYRAWNELCDKAQTPYVAIWNVDDLRTRHSLSSQLALMQTGKFRSVAGPFSIVREFGSTSGQVVDNSESPHSHWLEGMLHGPFFMFRKKDLSILHGFDEQFKVAGDFDFAIRLTSLGQVGYTRELLGHYLNQRSGLSTSQDSILPIERERIYLRYGVAKKFDYSMLHQVSYFDFTSLQVLGKRFMVEQSMKDFSFIRSTLIGEGNGEPLLRVLLRKEKSKVIFRIKSKFRYECFRTLKSLRLTK